MLQALVEGIGSRDFHGAEVGLLVPLASEHRDLELHQRIASDAATAFATPEPWPGALLAALLAAVYRPEDDRSSSAERYAAQNALTPRECEVLRWVYAGLRTSRIADRMGLQDVTVTKHLLSVRRKLKARTREQALAIAVRDGLIEV
ncbi:MAG: helix-turn-helix domain-containing protein [Rhodobacteraceae bacterium]|nr:helix-turn-helix domain-containing protein [Paracoccaceae bacterium]